MALLVLVAPTVAGCLALTPATGLCLGTLTGKETSCRQFDAQRAEMAARPPQNSPQRHEASDFELVYPGPWGPLSSLKVNEAGQEERHAVLDQTDAAGFSTLRVAVGRSIPLDTGGAVSEGLRVITVNRLDPTDRDAALADVTRRSLRQNFAGVPEVRESEALLSGATAYQVVMVGTSPNGGPVTRHVARARVHRDRGYIVMLSVPDAYWAQATATYERLFDGFRLRDADPPYPLPPLTAEASGSLRPSAPPVATASLKPPP